MKSGLIRTAIVLIIIAIVEFALPWCGLLNTECVAMQNRRVITESRISGEFHGWDGTSCFILNDGTAWVQTDSKILSSSSVNPVVRIEYESGSYFLVIAGSGRECRVKQTKAIRSQVIGEFRGWNGETVVKLQDGTVWKQAVYQYEYVYEYNPIAIVYEKDGRIFMAVAGTSSEVTRVK